MSPSIKHFRFLLLLLLFTSCATSKDAVEVVKLERRKTNDLLDIMDSLSLKKPDFLYSKISTKYEDNQKNLSFKTSLRMVKDSAINLLITYASFPIVNSSITTDTLTVVNKKTKCFIREDLTYLKSNFGVDFNYRNLEEIFLGIPLDYDKDQKYFQIHDTEKYIISSQRKNKIKRSEKKAKDDIVIKYFLNNTVDQLNGLEVLSPSDSTEIQVDYSSRIMVDGYSIPKTVAIKVETPRNKIAIELSYEKIEVNKPQELILVIPEGYERCE